MSRRLVVVSAGVGVPSSTRLLADQLAGAVRTRVTARGEALEVIDVEVRDLATDLAGFMVTGIPTPALVRVREQISDADALVVVSPVFTASYSGLFKMFVDALDPDALTGMPVLIAATAGTPRHSLVLDHALRPLFSYLRAVVVPTGVFAATEDFGSRDLDDRVARAASDLAALIVSSGGAAVAGFVPDAGDRRPRRDAGTTVPTSVTPFAQLLRGHDGRGERPQA